jgi:hypothetical protein
MSEVYDRAADLADRILRGAHLADLPFEQPTRFRLVINKKTPGNARSDNTGSTPDESRRDRRVIRRLLQKADLWVHARAYCNSR